MVSNEILVLLDKNLRRLGTLSPTSDHNFFWGENIKTQIADDSNSNNSNSDTTAFTQTDPNANSKMWGDEISGLTMLKDAPMAKNLVIGNSIARYNRYTDKWTVYRIISTDESFDESTGHHTISVEATNLAIWHLGKTIPAKKTINRCTLNKAMDWILAGSGWKLVNNVTSGYLVDMNFDGTSSSQSYLQQILTAYDCEVQTYMQFDEQSNFVDDLIIEISDYVGSNEPTKSIRYGKNMKSVHRNTVDSSLITKLYVYGNGGTTISQVNNGRNFITDSQANNIYNSDPTTWLEGVITSQTLTQPSSLMKWGQKQLRLYNHPRINYTVTVSSDFNPNLGDAVKIVDTEMTPELTVQARVIQKSESISNPYSNNVTLGEFATVKVVTPSFIKNLQSQYSNEAKKLFEKAKEDSNASSISLITPQGRSWYKDDSAKKCIARLYIDGVNVTSYLTPQSFNWQYIKRDGSHDYAWEQAHKNSGYIVDIDPNFVGTLLCSVNDEFTAKTGEVYINNDENSFFEQKWRTHANTNVWGDLNYGAIQCANYTEDGTIIGSYSYKGKQSTFKKENKNVVDTEFLHYNQNGDLLDAMILHGGGHGSSYTYNKNDHLIYTICKDYNGDKKWYIGALPYKPNQEATINDFVWRCKIDGFLRPVFDFNDNHNYMMGYGMNGTIVVCHIDDLKAGNFTPIIQCKLQDFGVTPSGKKGSVDGSTNTMQAGGLYYPFAFYSMGDVNNKDPRQILCVNLVSQSKVFMYEIENNLNVKLDVPTESGGHLEPEGIYYDKDTNSLMLGLNISEYTDSSKNKIKPVSSIYRVPLTFRHDDIVDTNSNYSDDDINIQTTDDSVKTVEDTDDEGYDLSSENDSSVPTSYLTDPNYISQNM